MANSQLRLSRAKSYYKCDICNKSITPRTPYFRDEPHPMARWHRGLKTRYICTNCAVGLDPTEFIQPHISNTIQASLPFEDAVRNLPNLLIKAAVIKLGKQLSEGHIVKAVTLPWRAIISQIRKDPACIYHLPWLRIEELIAGAYKREGWDEVILTPSSGDRGRDIIAIKHGICSIRIIDQVKAYAPDRYVTANDVRALLGVLSSDPNVSKGFVTTTAKFAPRIFEDPTIKPFIPYRLELKDGDTLRNWLIEVGKNRKGI